MTEHLIFNALCKAKHGTFLYNRNDTFIGKSIETYGEWSEQEVELFRTILHPGDTVIEAGSNIGTHTIPLAQIVSDTGRVFAFEAQRIIHQTLNANLALNDISNVHSYNIAVGAKNGSVVMPKINYFKPENFGAIDVHSHVQGERLPMVALDDFLKLKKLHFIKADIEDMEIQLIKGAEKLIEHFRPILYLENEPSKKHSEKLINMLLPLYDQIYWHVPLMYNPDNYAHFDKNIFGNYASFNILCLPPNYTRKIDLNHFKLKKITSKKSKPF